MRTTIEELKEALNTIGWDIKGEYPNSWIYNNFGERTDFRVLSDGIELHSNPFGKNGRGTICYNFKEAKIEKLSDDTISLGTKNIFVNFYNFDKARDKREGH